MRKPRKDGLSGNQIALTYFYEEVEQRQEHKIIHLICRICQHGRNVFQKNKTNPGVLKSHLKVKHSNATDPDKVYKPSEVHPQIKVEASERLSKMALKLLPSTELKAAAIRYFAAAWIATSLRPFSIVEDPWLKAVMGFMNAPWPSRFTVRHDVSRLGDQFLCDMAIELSTVQAFSITCDGWSAKNSNDHFVMMTMHYIDESWKSVSRVLGVVCNNKSANNSEISKDFKEMLQRAGLGGKVVTCITTDEGTNYRKFVEDTDVDVTFRNVACACHMLNTCIEHALKFHECPSLIQKTKSLVHSILKKKSVRNTYLELCEMNSGTLPVMACDTRWASHIAMARSVVMMELTIKELQQRKKLIPPQEQLDDLDFAALKCLVAMLEPLENILITAQSPGPVLGEVWFHIHAYQIFLDGWICKKPFQLLRPFWFPVLQAMQKALFLKFGSLRPPNPNVEADITDHPDAVLLALILDPRYKDFRSLDISERDNKRAIMLLLETVARVMLSQGSVGGSQRQSMDGINDQRHVNVSENEIPSHDHVVQGLLKARPTDAVMEYCSNAEHAVETYLRFPIPHEVVTAVDVLAFYQSNSEFARLCPIIRVVAREIFSIQVSNAASERLGSAAGFLMTKNRARLDTAMIDKMLVMSGYAPGVAAIVKEQFNDARVTACVNQVTFPTRTPTKRIKK